jgi:dynamin family protein
LPSGVVPVTSVVTVVRHGARRSARVRLRDGEWLQIDPSMLADYVSEDRNPDNRKGVVGVEVRVPAQLLIDGMSLVDTPGLGSTTEAGVAATKAFVPHIDAAVVVLGADPPISGDELELVTRIAAVTSRLIFVLNKADRVGEGDRREAAQFAERVVRERVSLRVDRMLVVSAVEALKGDAEDYDWHRLVTTLEGLCRTSGADMLRDAEMRGVQALAEALQAEIEMQRAALVRPLADSEAHVTRLRQAQRHADEALQDLGKRLLGVQERLLRQFDDARDAFFAKALADATAEVRTRLSRAGVTTRSGATDVAASVAMGWLERWEREQEPRAEALYREATERFVQLVNAAAEALSGAEGLERLPRLAAEPGFRTRRQVRYTHMLRVAPVSVIARLMDCLRTARSRRRVIMRDASAYLERLLAVNSARIKNDFSDRVVESRRLLERDLERRLADLSAAADRALRHARDAQADGTEAIRARLDWLEHQRAIVSSVSTG